MHTNKNKSYELSYASVICMNNETRLELTIQLRCLLFGCVLLSPAWFFFFFFKLFFFLYFRSFVPCDDYYYYLFRITEMLTHFIVCSFVVCLALVSDLACFVCMSCVVFVRLPESRAHLLNLLRILITRSSRACIPFHRLRFYIQNKR